MFTYTSTELCKGKKNKKIVFINEPAQNDNNNSLFLLLLFFKEKNSFVEGFFPFFPFFY